MPEAPCAKRVTPAPWLTTHRPSRAARGVPPGVADQTAPVSSSRRKITSPVGSVTASFANGVRRFSRLFTDHVNEDPDAVTTVPKSGFAITFAQGSGVSRPPSRTTTYSRPSREKPPIPFAIVSGGTSASGSDGIAASAAARGKTSRGHSGSGTGKSSCSASSPRSPERTARAAAEKRIRSGSASPSPRTR